MLQYVVIGVCGKHGYIINALVIADKCTRMKRSSCQGVIIWSRRFISFAFVQSSLNMFQACLEATLLQINMPLKQTQSYMPMLQKKDTRRIRGLSCVAKNTINIMFNTF